jgi:hypothetical protein
MFSLGLLRTAMAATAAAQARDARRLEPLVCLFSFLFITLIFFLGPLNASKRELG